jgi:hypothetical protein
MAQTIKYYLKNNYLTLRSKVITVRDTPPYGHAPKYQISLTYLERQKSYGPDKLRWEEAAEEEEAEAEEKITLKQYVSLRSKGRHNKTETSRVSLIEQPNFGCSRYVALQDALGKIEGTAIILIIDV